MLLISSLELNNPFIDGVVYYAKELGLSPEVYMPDNGGHWVKISIECAPLWLVCDYDVKKSESVGHVLVRNWESLEYVREFYGIKTAIDFMWCYL